MDLSEKKAALDNKIMKLFSTIGVDYITHPVAKTNKGSLEIMLRKGETAINYRFVLDSVPVEDEMNDSLKELFKLA